MKFCYIITITSQFQPKRLLSQQLETSAVVGTAIGLVRLFKNKTVTGLDKLCLKYIIQLNFFFYLLKNLNASCNRQLFEGIKTGFTREML
jgi:hypothetical protein